MSPTSRTSPLRLSLTIGALATSLALVGCGDEDDSGGVCRGAKIFPHISPFVLGESYPTPDNEDDWDYGSADMTPYEATLLLQAPCEGAVEVEEVCLLGDSSDQYLLEGPAPSNTITRNREVGMRLTYMRKNPAEADNVALVVQSNAENFPTLVVPVCARVIGPENPRMPIECEAPESVPEVPEGTRDDSLCGMQ